MVALHSPDQRMATYTLISTDLSSSMPIPRAEAATARYLVQQPTPGGAYSRIKTGTYAVRRHSIYIYIAIYHQGLSLNGSVEKH